jgi:phosphoribosyl 1,2-cyclic phosphodiesterase
MKLKFYGVRGSIPACGPGFEIFGGNTTCIRLTLEQAKRTIIIDAGTGIRNLGKDLAEEGIRAGIINLSFTHFHWDHIQGFPFFAPAYDPANKINIHVMGCDRQYLDIREIFSQQMIERYFPVSLESMGATFDFLSHGDEETFYGAKVTAAPQHHKVPGGSYGLRVEDESGTVAICTDAEHIDGIDERVVQLAMDADLLVHDGQYTDEEYKKYKGWGHSSWRHCAETAKAAGAKRLIVTHHDPDHDDAFLLAMEAECKAIFPNSCFAREGMEIII